MTRAELEALALRCEQASGPDRELDAEIALALGIVRERDGACFYGHHDHSVMVLERGYYDHEGNAPELPHYTSSLDAAMTLVPERAWVRMDEWPRDFCAPVATVCPMIVEKDNPTYTATGSTLALALTAAALRAHAKEASDAK